MRDRSLSRPVGRRRALAIGAAALGGVAGCLGSSDVSLVATDEAFEWYSDDAARFVDARSRAEYERLHIEGAVLSPADDGLEENDPVEEWSTDTRIVTYCVCPHALATSRAESLLDDGYEDVHALDEGLEDWYERGYPVAGSEVEASLPEYELRGRTDPEYAGREVWLREPETNQREVTTIESDGTYAMTFHFVDLTAETPLSLETPSYDLEAPLAELTDGVITG